jgi:hypothetical protein
MQKALWGLGLLVLAHVVMSEASCGGIAVGVPSAGGGSAGSGGVGGTGGVGGGGGIGGEGGGPFLEAGRLEASPGEDAGDDEESEDVTDEAGPPLDSAVPIDASGLLPPTCEACVSSMCPVYAMCLEDPSCTGALECTHRCTEAGGQLVSCAIACFNDAGSGIAKATFDCAQAKCAATCEGPLDAGKPD